MPKVIVTSMTPSELFAHSLKRARGASAEIERLKTAPLAAGETLHERLLVVATQAHELSEAFEIIEALAATVDESLPTPGAVVTVTVSPLESCEEPPQGHRGVRHEEDPNTN